MPQPLDLFQRLILTQAATTVTSSIRALASSLGIKRSTSSKSALGPTPSNSASSLYPSVDQLTQFSAPYSALPNPDPMSLQTDHFTFDPTPSLLKKFDFHNATDTTPLPGHALRPGVPAPANARLSMGIAPATPSRVTAGPTTTLRLVSNPDLVKARSTLPEPSTPILKPFTTSFDLVLGSPSSAMPLWPSAAQSKSLYPDISAEMPEKKVADNQDHDMEDATFQLPPSPSQNSTMTPIIPSPSPDVFVFGSPNPKHRASGIQFSAVGVSVLEEANRRLREAGVSGIDASTVNNFRNGSSQVKPANDGRPIKPCPGVSDIKSKFDKAHAKEFNKMEDIASYAARRAGSTLSKNPVASDGAQIGTKRKSNVLGDDKGHPRRPTTSGIQTTVAQTRVISNGRRKGGKIPGAFDDEEGEDSSANEDDRGGKKPRVEFDDSETKDEEGLDEERQRLARERDAIKKKLEVSRARRRSSAANTGRVSMGNRRMSRGNVLRKRAQFLTEFDTNWKFYREEEERSQTISLWLHLLRGKVHRQRSLGHGKACSYSYANSCL